MASFYKAPVLVLWLNNLYYIIRLLCGGCTWIPFISWQIIVFFKCSQVFPSEGVLSTDRGHELWPNGPQSLLACVNTILGRGSLSRKNHHPLILLLAVSVISVHQHNAVVYNNSDSCHSMASSSTIFVCSFLVLNVVPSAMWAINIKIFYVHELEELILIKCPYRPKQSTVNAVPIKIPRALFTHTKKSPNAWENHKRPWIDKAIYRSRTNLEVSHILILNFIIKL